MVGVVVKAFIMATMVVVVVGKVVVWAGADFDIVLEVLVFGARGIIVEIAVLVGARGIIVEIAVLDGVEIILAGEVVVGAFVDVSAEVIIGIVLGIGDEVLAGVDVNVSAAVVTDLLAFPMATTLEECRTWAACDCWPIDFFNCDRVLQACMPLCHV